MITDKSCHSFWVINYKVIYIVVIYNIRYICWRGMLIPLRILILIILHPLSVILIWVSILSVCLIFLQLTADFLHKIVVFLCLLLILNKRIFYIKCLSLWFFSLLLSLRGCLYAVSQSCFRFSFRTMKRPFLIPCRVPCFQIDCTIDVVTYVAIFIHLNTL